MSPELSSCQALILAAGFSTRMGSFKPLLRLGDSSCLQRLVSLYRKAGLERISVVCGHKAEELISEAGRLGASCVVNPKPREGMLSSVKAGLASILSQSRAPGRLFVHPADIPLVRPDTIALMLRAAERSDGLALLPAYDGETGHPPLLGSGLFRDILEYGGEGGLQAVLEAHAPEIVPVADRNILLDLDEPPDYLKACLVLENRAGLTAGEAEKLLRLYFRAAPKLYAHCKAVAGACEAILDALAAAGVILDRDLALSGAWLHDLAKGEAGHPALGGQKLRELGFARLAGVVAAHNICRWPEDRALDEAALVALADKLVEGESVVRLEERFQGKLAEYGADPETAGLILERMQGMRRLAARFEQAAGKTLDSILALHRL
jgi:CTP:molybdopterin cytidylyltransferase MocA